MAEKKLGMRFDIPGIIEIRCKISNANGLILAVKNGFALQAKVSNKLGNSAAAANFTRG